MKSLLVFVACAALLVVGAAPASAASGPPVPACHPGVGPCQETDHFSELVFIGSPLPGCQTVTEPVLIDAVGNGLQHITVNAAQDFWTTSTMEGAATVVQGSIGLDSNGNPVFIPDGTKPTFSGHFQQWFGESINRSNASISGTTNFQGTSTTGASVSLHFNLHLNSTGAIPFAPNPSSMHFDVSCS
jgi:hypothetical protein